MDELFFSVTISAYNASSFIFDTLDSVRNQTYKNFEVILVDDGSPERMESAIAKYKEMYPDFPLRYIWQENEGPGGARRRGVVNAKYEYVAMLDHDDRWTPDKLQVMHDVIKENDADVYYHDERLIFTDGSSRSVDYRELGDDPLTDLIINGNCLSTSAVVVRKTFFMECDPYSDRQRYGEDYECWIRLAKAGARFYHVERPLAEYVRSAESLTMVNEDYTRAMNDRIVDFYDYLNSDKFSKDDIQRMKEERRVYNEFLLGRFYHNRKDYYKARKYYFNAIKHGQHSFKTFVAYAMSLFHIRLRG
ncbi:MAG: glycosyltransferase family 2 protein [Lachnospiraceae bacterium]|nr:glycosyltransferase family 2 protein [Lachnospiraceae bacterium]